MTLSAIWRVLLTFGCLLIAAVWLAASEPERKSDLRPYWPQFHGPRRDNRSDARGLLKRWPEDGPKLAWRADAIGDGFASISIADGAIYTAGNVEAQTVITAIDLGGNKLWQTTSGPAFQGSFRGSRATPTFAAGNLYHQNGNGHLVCLRAEDGKLLWKLNTLEKFHGRQIRWGLAESVLIDGRRLICTPGGERVSMVALDRDTGETLWTCKREGDKPAYASPILVEYGGLRQYITVMSKAAVGVHAETGRLLWRYEHEVAYDANCDTPVYHDGRIALFGTWGHGATCLQLNVDGNSCSVEEVWRNTDLDNEHGGVVLIDGYLYGQANGNRKDPHWACLEWETGKTMYVAQGLRDKSGTLTYADGMLYLLGDRRTVALMPPNPNRFEVVSQFDLPTDVKGTSWARPVVCGGRLYIRYVDALYAFDVRGSEDGLRKFSVVTRFIGSGPREYVKDRMNAVTTNGR